MAQRIKKMFSLLPCLLFLLIALYPTGVLAAACFGYAFELTNTLVFAASVAVVSACTVIADLVFPVTYAQKITRIILTAISPTAFIAAVFYAITCPQVPVVACILFSVLCCCYLTVRHARSTPLRITAAVLSGISFYLVCSLCFFALLFGSIGQNTVVKTVESPGGTYYALVIDSDQGALGGDTIVNVCPKESFTTLIFTVKKKPQTVYTGPWGAYKNMWIYWKDSSCLVINDTEYDIKQ